MKTLLDLKKITRLGSDGSPTTDICLVEESGYKFGNLDERRVIWNLGSMGNGGFDTLIQLANSINRLFLESTLTGKIDGVVECRSFGLVHLSAQMLYQLVMGKTKPETLEEFDKEQWRYSGYLPSLIAALLDESIPSAAPVEYLQRRVYFPKDSATSPKLIRGLFKKMSLSGVLYRYDGLRCEYFNRLWTWATQDIFPRLSPEEEVGMERLAGLAQFIRATSEKNTGSNWETIASHLRALHAIRVDMGIRTFILTTRPTATQLSFLYRLQVPVPPLVFEEKTCKEEVIPMCEKSESWQQQFEPEWI